MQNLHAFLRPESLNRVDGVIAFHALGDEDLIRVADLMLERVRRRART